MCFESTKLITFTKGKDQECDFKKIINPQYYLLF